MPVRADVQAVRAGLDGLAEVEHAAAFKIIAEHMPALVPEHEVGVVRAVVDAAVHRLVRRGDAEILRVSRARVVDHERGALKALPRMPVIGVGQPFRVSGRAVGRMIAADDASVGQKIDGGMDLRPRQRAGARQHDIPGVKTGLDAVFALVIAVEEGISPLSVLAAEGEIERAVGRQRPVPAAVVAAIPHRRRELHARLRDQRAGFFLSVPKPECSFHDDLLHSGAQPLLSRQISRKKPQRQKSPSRRRGSGFYKDPEAAIRT